MFFAFFCVEKGSFFAPGHFARAHIGMGQSEAFFGSFLGSVFVGFLRFLGSFFALIRALNFRDMVVVLWLFFGVFAALYFWRPFVGFRRWPSTFR